MTLLCVIQCAFFRFTIDIKQGKTVLSYHTYCCGAGVAFLPEGITLACDEASGDPKPGTEQMCDNFNHKKVITFLPF